jgi:DNA-binding protein HU-beta
LRAEAHQIFRRFPHAKLAGNLQFRTDKKEETLNKTQLIDAIAKSAKLNKTQASHALKATFEAIGDTLRRGQKVALIGFGTFSTAMRKARKGIHPRTKKAIRITARRIPKFKAGKELKRLIAKVK